MAPLLNPALPVRSVSKGPDAHTDTEHVQYPTPLQSSGALDNFAFEETTPAIGREYADVNIVDDLLHAPNSDELVRDLAIASMFLSLLLPARQS